ncbi:long-chain fatty acid--CoA ligase [Kutzneria viridogrisea]|uniref:AMP-dependent synthetase and ligase n=2 Tax=Kutzneria TaxID=43356 RepID=W5WEE1_9PSEU|nr:long-chain fatty acid--CoA ligase [Kutzneria albida]AHH99558.1 hypothetical protein KALB_6198 [Kutzneria albida DSM 43870]MBA8922887.1 long-chain acyl-CoA synthetase [Kutzneria viridogrisea]
MRLSLATILAESAKRVPDKTALIESGHRLTYRELWRQARSCAARLHERGVRPGDHVALLAPNVADFARNYYGILALGAAVVPVPTLLNAEEAAHILTHSRARAVVCERSCVAVGERAAELAGIPLLDAGDWTGHEPVPSYELRDPGDTAVVFYTSGTTGQPKGAVLTHLNLVMNATVNAFDANPLYRDDVVLGCLPLFHTFGQTVSMNSTFRVGGTLVLQPRFDADEAIELVHAERVTAFFGVPTMYMRLLDRAARHAPVTTLRSCVSGGASLPVAVLERFEAQFATTVYEGYGLSETSPTASVNQQCYGARPGTVGHPVWGVDVEIARADLEDRIELLPVGESGEIVIRGHNVFAGYLDDPEATRAAVVDGWFRTGDIGVKDAEGFVSVVDRKKDLIIRGGYNVYPREVEEVLARHPAVGQVAVIGLPDELRGEEVVAVVVAKPGADTDAAAIIAWAREHLAGHKYPRRVEFVAELPMGPSHKVLKRELRRILTTPKDDDV